jgi:hypothetical protein
LEIGKLIKGRIVCWNNEIVRRRELLNETLMKYAVNVKYTIQMCRERFERRTFFEETLKKHDWVIRRI